MLGLGLSSRANLLTNNGLSSKVNPVCLNQPRKPVGNPYRKPSRKPAVESNRKIICKRRRRFRRSSSRNQLCKPHRSMGRKSPRKPPRKTSIPSLISTLPVGRRRVWASIVSASCLRAWATLKTACTSCMLRARTGKAARAPISPTCCQAAGYRVGWFSSPFIERFEERIRVDGKNIGYARPCARHPAGTRACRANVGGNR